jgi:hypothetical protein
MAFKVTVTNLEGRPSFPLSEHLNDDAIEAYVIEQLHGRDRNKAGRKLIWSKEVLPPNAA